MIKVLLVKVGKIAEVVEFKTFTAVQRAVGIKPNEEWYTMELDGMPNFGIIAPDQDKPRLKQNRLGVKGSFAIIGMTVKKEPTQAFYSFTGLTEDEARDLRLSLSLTTLRNLHDEALRDDLGEVSGSESETSVETR
jgi:hypothetical protein